MAREGNCIQCGSCCDVCKHVRIVTELYREGGARCAVYAERMALGYHGCVDHPKSAEDVAEHPTCGYRFS